MAWESGNAELGKKNAKFESFLKRTLPDEVFERVRAYDSCIVISENENKTFKYVVLSDEKLYLTENPPKALQEVMHLKDIVSMELVNEYPEFLGGLEKVNTQHIAITYTTSEPRRRSFRRAKKSPRGSLTELSENRSSTSTPRSYTSSIDGNFIEDLGFLTQSTSSLPRFSNSNSLKTGVLKKKRKPAGLNDSLEHGNLLRSLKEELDEDMLEDNKNDRLSVVNSAVQSSSSFGSINSSAQSMSRKLLSSPEIGQDVRDSQGRADSDRKLIRRGLNDKGYAVSPSQQSLRLLPPLQGTKSSFLPTATRKFLGQEVDIVDIKGCCSFFRSYRTKKNQITPTYRNPGHTLESQDQAHKEEGLPNVGSNFCSGSQISVKQGGLTSRSLTKSSRSGTPLLDTEYKLNEFNTSFSDLDRSSSLNGLNTLSVDGVTERRKCILNIYLLNLDSPLLLFITCAWNNYMIRSTLQLELEQFDIQVAPVPLSSSRRDKVECKYSQIKRDLLQPHLSLEEQYVLIDQLCCTTKSNTVLKNLFWKNSDMLSFFIDQLQKYLPKSTVTLKTDEDKIQRADEIEFAILILSTINLMLRETEILPCRLQTLKLEGGKHVLNLLKVLTLQHDFPFRPFTLKKHWSAPVAENGKLQSDRQSDRNVDEELVRLKAEYNRISITSVFELIQVAKQALSEETRILTVAGMVSMFQGKKTVERFMDYLLSQIMELVSLSRFDILSPIQVLLVFQMFSLLLTFLEHCNKVVSHIRNKYYEEFKYFIQAPMVSRKLPQQYPITPITAKIIDQVVVKVLGSPLTHPSKSH